MNRFELPNDYKFLKKIDLQKNIKLAIFVNILSLVIAAVVFALGFLIKPINFSVSSVEESVSLMVSAFSLVGLSIIYMVLHEMVHGIFFKKYSGQKAKYGFTGLYAYAKSEAYYNKKEFITVGLSPIVILGLILLVLNIIFYNWFFWVIFAIQVVNISGAAGDLYVTYVLLKMPDDILVKDDGVSMTIYGK